MVRITHSAEETIALAHQMAQELPENSIVCLFGDLGAGKTTFVKGIASAFTEQLNTDTVTSPTFVHLNIYNGKRTVYHFDLYRLQDAHSFFDMGFDELLYAGGICCIEWSERIEQYLPAHSIRVHISHVAEGKRSISIQ